MKLIIHDFSPGEWAEAGGEYAGWTAVANDGSARPCVGCFSCWSRTPGQCVLRDGYEHMGRLIHRAEEVVIASRYTYGGFSGAVKGVMDRCLGYVLPQFEIAGGESHHRRRYDEDKPFTFIFRGHGLGDAEKDSARRYARAVCANTRGHVKDVIFREGEPLPPSGVRPGPVPAGRVALLNGSMRCDSGNSAKLARQLLRQLNRDAEIVNLRQYLGDPSGLLAALEGVSDIVLCVPLYLDGLPAQVIRFMEAARRECRGTPRRVYTLANMGLYESGQLANLFEAVRQWCVDMRYEYCGGLGVSAGEVIGVLMDHLPFGVGFTARVAAGMKRLAAAINGEGSAEDIFAQPCCFPRWLYVAIANGSWNRAARANGLKPEDLYRRL